MKHRKMLKSSAKSKLLKANDDLVEGILGYIPTYLDDYDKETGKRISFKRSSVTHEEAFYVSHQIKKSIAIPLSPELRKLLKISDELASAINKMK